MVTDRRRARIRGASTLGCLVSLVLTVGVLYYGITLGRVWWRYKELQNRMETAARFGQTQSVDQITRQLQAEAQDLGIPPEGRRFRITKSDAPASITISTSYTEHVSLPLLDRSFSFHPSVTQKFF
jgi:hypothetical protein